MQQQQQQRFETKKSRLVFWSQQENEDIELWLGFQWEGGLVSSHLDSASNGPEIKIFNSSFYFRSFL